MDQTFFAGNRQALLTALKRGALVVVTGYEEMQRGNDAAASFDQEANFWYLTGVEKPGWWLILDGAHGTEWLVAPELTESQKVFDGGVDADLIKKRSGVRTILDRDEATRRLRQLVKYHSMVYTTEQPKYLRDHAHFQLNNAQSELKKLLERTYQNVQICNKELATLRTIKQPAEIAAIQRAINLTTAAFTQMRTQLTKAKYEYELEAVLSHEMRRKGARHAYDPIIAAGPNACTLHYGANQDKLIKKQLVLLDVGARVDGYAADISRTYSVGQPTKRQRDIHQAVQLAQTEIIGLLKPGLTFQAYEERVEQIMKAALVNLKLSTDRYREYFPHAIGHGLGVDVHDPLAGYDVFATGMVVTVEPGLYVRDEGIGVRIEDDILITENGHRNLSRALSTELG